MLSTNIQISDSCATTLFQQQQQQQQQHSPVSVQYPLLFSPLLSPPGLLIPRVSTIHTGKYRRVYCVKLHHVSLRLHPLNLSYVKLVGYSTFDIHIQHSVCTTLYHLVSVCISLYQSVSPCITLYQSVSPLYQSV